MGTQICKNADTVVICCPKFAWALNHVGVTVYTKHHCSKCHFPNEKKKDHGFQAQTQYWEHCSLQVNLLRYKRLISKSSDPEALTKELRVCINISYWSSSNNHGNYSFYSTEADLHQVIFIYTQECKQNFLKKTLIGRRQISWLYKKCSEGIDLGTTKNKSIRK